MISRKIYTAGTNFTRPPVVTVATNLNSESQVPQKSWLPSNQTSWDKYMLNGISRHKSLDMSQLVRLEGKHIVQSTHCAVQCSACDLVDKPRRNVALTQLGFPFVSWQGSGGSGAMRHTNVHCWSTFLPAQNPLRPDLQQMGAFFILRRGADNPW